MLARLVWPLVLALIIGQAVDAAHVMASVVVAVLEKDLVILGADSLTSTELASTTRCKTTDGGNSCSFAMSGLLDSIAPSFDAAAIAREACKLPGGIKAKADGFLVKATPRLQAVVTAYHSHPRWPQRFKPNMPLLNVILAGLQDGQLSLAHREFYVDVAGLLKSESSAGEVGKTIITGSNGAGAIPNYIKQNPDWQTRLSPVEIARKFVELARADPKVGGPRSILEIRPTGSRWVEKGVCGNGNNGR